MAAELNFYFEFASTYSYLSSARIAALGTTYGVRINYLPFLLGPIFKAQGWDDSPFNIYENKGRYMWTDMGRLCKQYGLPLTKPSVFPRSGLQAARITLALDNEQRAVFVPKVFAANFGEDRATDDPAVLTEILNECEFDDVPAILEKAKAPELKKELRAAGEKAVELGIFGAPSFITKSGELYWGNDRLEMALETAQNEG